MLRRLSVAVVLLVIWGCLHAHQYAAQAAEGGPSNQVIIVDKPVPPSTPTAHQPSAGESRAAYGVMKSDGITYIPVRLVAERFGARIEFSAKTRIITISYLSRNVSLRIGDSTAHVNGKGTKTGAKSFEWHGVTYVPVRFVSEALGMHVSWDPVWLNVTIDNSAQLVEDSLAADSSMTIYVRVPDDPLNSYVTAWERMRGSVNNPDYARPRWTYEEVVSIQSIQFAYKFLYTDLRPLLYALAKKDRDLVRRNAIVFGYNLDNLDTEPCFSDRFVQVDRLVSSASYCFSRSAKELRRFAEYNDTHQFDLGLSHLVEGISCYEQIPDALEKARYEYP